MRPQDIILLAKLATSERKDWTSVALAEALGVSQPEISLSLSRSVRSGLLSSSKKEVARNNLFEFIMYGLRYVFPVVLGPVTRGIPTGHSAQPLSAHIASGGEEFVWPQIGGPVRGQSVKPLYPSVPEIVVNDGRLYEVLALIDAIRIGRPREVEIARRELKGRIG